MLHRVAAHQDEAALGVDHGDLDHAEPALGAAGGDAAGAVAAQHPGKTADQADDDHERQHETAEINQIHCV